MRYMTASKSPYHIVIFVFVVYHGIKGLFTYRHICFCSLSRYHRALFVPSFSLPMNFTAPKSSFHTVIFAFGVYHGIIELFSYRHFLFQGISRVPKSSFHTVKFAFAVYHGIIELLSYRHFLFQGIPRHHKALSLRSSFSGHHQLHFYIRFKAPANFSLKIHHRLHFHESKGKCLYDAWISTKIYAIPF
jgi:hypothetical protein